MNDRRLSHAIIVTLSLTFGTVFMHRQSINPFLQEFALRFDTGFAGAGVLLSVLSAAYALVMLPAGWITDRASNRLLASTGALLVTVGTVITAYAPTYGLAVFSRALIGASMTLCHCATVRQISGLADPSRLGATLAIRDMIRILGIMGGLAGMPFLVRFMSIERALLLICIPLIALAMAVFVLPERHYAAPTRGQAAQGLPWNSRIACLLPIGFAAFAVINGLNGWLPTILRLHHGFDAAAAGLMVTGILILMVPVSLVTGLIADRTGWRGELAAVGSVLFGAAVAAWSVTGLRVMPAVALVFTGIAWGVLAPTVVLMGVEAGGLRPGWSTAVVATIAQIGSAISAYVMGLLLDVTGGFSGQFRYLGGAAVVSLVVCLATRRVVRAPRKGVQTAVQSAGCRSPE